VVSEGLEPPPLAVWRRRSAAELTDRCYARPERFELPPSRFVAGRSYPLSYGRLVAATGAEPVSSALSGQRSFQLSYATMAAMTGLEPVAPGLTARCSDQLSYITVALAEGVEPSPCGLTVRCPAQLDHARSGLPRFAVHLPVLARGQPSLRRWDLNP
jgi:hypothetical protein